MLVMQFEAAKTDPAKREEMREVAKGYLKSFADPDRVQITDKGLALSPAAAPE